MAEYIEREAALRQFTIDKNGNRIREVDVDNWLVELPIRQVKKMLREVPAADVAPVKHGRWEHMDNDWFDLWKCTVCGEEWGFGYDPTSTDTKVNYCPECGAKMDEEG